MAEAEAGAVTEASASVPDDPERTMRSWHAKLRADGGLSAGFGERSGRASLLGVSS